MTATDSIFQRAVSNLLTEIFDGLPGPDAYVLNSGDPGLLRQLDTLDAGVASARPMPGKTTIAAHVDHIHYGLLILNRWAAGDANAWAGARLDRQLAACHGHRRSMANPARHASPRSRNVAKDRRRPHGLG